MPEDQDTVPVRNKVTGDVIRIPRSEVPNAVRFHQGQRISEDEFQKGMTKYGRPVAPTPALAPTPAAPTQVAAKPSAAIGGPAPAQYTIRGPGGVGTNLSTKPPGIPPPAGPLAATPEGRAVPPADVPPPAGPLAATEEGRAVKPNLPMTTPTLSATPSSSEVIGRTASDIGIGMAKRVPQEMINAARFATGLPIPDVPGLEPKSKMQELGGGAADIATFMAAFPSSEIAGVEFADMVGKFAPKVAATMGKSLDFVGRTLYNGITGAVAGAATERDPLKSAAIQMIGGSVLEGAEKLSAATLKALWGVKEIMGGRTGEIMLREMGSPSTRTGIGRVVDLYKSMGPITRGGFYKRAGEMLDITKGEINRLSAAASAGANKVSVSLPSIMGYLEDTIAKAPLNQQARLRGLLGEVENSLGSTAPGKISAALDEGRKIAARIARRREELATAPVQQMRTIIQEAITKDRQEVQNIWQSLGNQNVDVTPAQLNRLRRNLADSYVAWGKLSPEEKMAQAEIRKVYDSIVAVQKGVMPDLASRIDDENALHDIWASTSKLKSAGFGIHTLHEIGALPRTIAGFAGWQIGRQYGGTAGGIGGAIAGFSLAGPTMAAGSRAVASPTLGALGVGAAQTSWLNPKQKKDWSEQGKRTPFKNTTE